MQNKRFFLDSTAWILNFLGESKKAQQTIANEENTILTSVLSFYEVPKFFMKRNAEREIPAALEIMRRRSAVMGLDEKICSKAAEDSIKHNLYTIDAIILRSAVETNAVLVTDDKDFRNKGIKNTIFL